MVKRLIFPAILLSSLVIKSIITPTIADSLSILCLTVLFGVMYFIETKKETPVNEEIRQQLQKQQEELTWNKSELDKLNSFMSASKLSTSFGRK